MGALEIIEINEAPPLLDLSPEDIAGDWPMNWSSTMPRLRICTTARNRPIGACSIPARADAAH